VLYITTEKEMGIRSRQREKPGLLPRTRTIPPLNGTVLQRVELEEFAIYHWMLTFLVSCFGAGEWNANDGPLLFPPHSELARTSEGDCSRLRLV
jgi:hypothetical protein